MADCDANCNILFGVIYFGFHQLCSRQNEHLTWKMKGDPLIRCSSQSAIGPLVWPPSEPVWPIEHSSNDDTSR